MNKTRITKNICALGLSLVLISGCKKYLEPEPISKFGNDFVFSSVQNANLAIMGVYDPLSGDNCYGRTLSLYFPYDTDEGAISGAALDNGRRSIGRYDVSSANTEITKPFNDLYAGIDRANICIEQIPLMDLYTNGTPAQKADLQRMHGEALTIRAQFYLELLRNWGDLPAPMIPSYKQSDLFVSKENRDAVYDQLLEDLKLAATLVPWRSQANYEKERVTQGAIRGLRARIALHRGGYSLRRESGQMERRADYLKYYEIARTECAEIINSGQHGLNAKYEDVFHKYMLGLTQDPAGEIIFEVAMAGTGSKNDSKIGYASGIKINSGNSTFGYGNPLVNALPNYFYAFDSTDHRRDVTIAPYELDASSKQIPLKPNTFFLSKFRRDKRSPLDGSSAQYLGINWPLIRYSDVLLMFAEAENEIDGPTALAVSKLTEVRQRAYGTASIGTVPTSSKDEFFKAIMKERWLEFGNEGIRKYDLIRWNMLGTRLAETKEEIKAIGDTTKFPRTMEWRYKASNPKEIEFRSSFYQVSPIRDTTGVWTKLDWGLSMTTDFINNVAANFYEANKDELMPINQASINANLNLKQDYIK